MKPRLRLFHIRRGARANFKRLRDAFMAEHPDVDPFDATLRIAWGTGLRHFLAAGSVLTGEYGRARAAQARWGRIS